MDIAKLLSRTIKQKKSAPGENAVTTKLPSAGTSVNPQLYHDAIPESRGKKRKRGVAEQVEPQSLHKSEGDDLNFFATKEPKTKGKQSVPSKNVEPAKLSTPMRTLDEEECKQILRSHRLKVTVLPKPEVKKVKKSKKNKVVQKPEKVKIKELFPQPLMSFGELRTTYGIAGRLNDNLAEQGYKIPTEVQMGGLPLLLRPETALGHAEGNLVAPQIDLLAVAPTGSGKTLAFLIPVVNGILQRRRLSSDKRIHDLEAVIVAPTKELASQIVNEAKKLCIGTGVKVIGMRKGLRIVGNIEPDDGNDEGSSDESEEGESDEKSKSQPSAKSDILVTTPGLLQSALSAGSKEPASLPTVRTLVLDEADVLLDPLFRDQTLSIWTSCTNPKLRVTLWSATMGSNIETLASTTIHSRRSALEIDDNSSIVRLIVGLKDSAIPNVTHKLIYAATEPGKLLALRQLLHPTTSSTDSTASLRPPFLVFTQTIPRATALHSELLYDIPASAGGSTRIAVLHSSLSSPLRAQIMTRFRAGEIWVLITTDILSRGVDFRGINGVVNYDVPNSAAAYIHRVGRTGRAGREGGVAVTLYTKEDIPYVKNVVNVIAASEKAAGKIAGKDGEGGGIGVGIQKWLLDALPTPSKDEKKKLKKFGNEARRGGLGEGREGNEAKKGKGRMQISTKSGYERKLENNRRGAIQGSKRRMVAEREQGLKEPEGEESEWGGIQE